MATRKWLLRQNRDMKKASEAEEIFDGEKPPKIFNWTLPALTVHLPGRDAIRVCKQADACVSLCYARTGTYMFSNVRAHHIKNLLMVVDSLPEWEAAMADELRHKRYANAAIRIHDSGDFLSADYLNAWVRIMRGAPGIRFYCYTKEVALIREHVEPDPPSNFRWCFSLGGKQDHLLDLRVERHADVFPDEESIIEAGYSSQTRSDLLAVDGPPHVGIPANNIRHLRKRQGHRSFGQIEADLRSARKARRAGTDPRSPHSQSAPDQEEDA
ncbi:GP88 family protein [Streptomyces mirabilis]|uniref:GP88 family protein n=1 Tax=Streptomyces mirabilis TaxID=68239 RepID=UPI0033DC9612